mmetsp:Transcript_34076/g.49502  ORF Transcript_34076/g.49502 Transcript_34076/m.49502 type:complete len:90 (+) Transcript_34076:54-323(+)
MAYVRSDGTVVQNRSIFRISFITDIIWGVLNTLELFVRTLINPTAPIPKKKSSAYDTSSNGRGGPSQSQSRKSNGPNIRSLPKDCPKGG